MSVGELELPGVVERLVFAEENLVELPDRREFAEIGVRNLVVLKIEAAVFPVEGEFRFRERFRGSRRSKLPSQ